MELTTYEDWIHLLELAEAGDNVAQGEVALHYDSGLILKGTEIVEEDQSMAFKWYYSAYENGNITVVTRIADFLIEGLYCEQNIELAIELYQKGIDNRYGIAANNLAVFYRDKQDYKKAFELYKLAQHLDSSDSLPLALCYYFGIGTERNLNMAFEIFNNISKAESANYQYHIDEANYFLGRIYLEGEIVEKSIVKARAFLKLANADDDHRSAQELLMIIGKND
ncbi:tetratricopeptide repeat protein [Mucilaginibacter dorajii]|uniref:Sel1 repeat family protein n=1 Tax=Mucilaginibacter dorajii TaxID=692994 RepID=A0ABP7P1L0_9SPHI|nr:tetratricopeptide repeat protein [Mucilaginibacter dorajii]MCS3735500.1 TPR repeat protein [Mucilaginibacter dorajii]